MGFWSLSSTSRHTSAWRRRCGVPKLSTREHRTIRRASGLSRRQYRRVVHRNRAYARSKYTSSRPTGKYKGWW